MVVSCLKTQMISQAYIIVNWLKHYGKISFGVILNLAFFFNLLMNGYIPVIEMFLF